MLPFCLKSFPNLKFQPTQRISKISKPPSFYGQVSHSAPHTRSQVTFGHTTRFKHEYHTEVSSGVWGSKSSWTLVAALVASSVAYITNTEETHAKGKSSKDDEIPDMPVARADQKYMEKALSYMQSGKYEEALKLWIRLEPTYGSHIGWINFQKASCYLNMGNPEKALIECQQALKKEPTMNEAVFMLAGVYTVLNKPEEALRILQDFVKDTSQTNELIGMAYSLMAEPLMMLNKYEDALDATKKAEKATKEPRVLLTSAFVQSQVYADTGKFKEALDSIEKYESLVPAMRKWAKSVGFTFDNPQNPQIQETKAVMLCQLNRQDEGIIVLDNAMSKYRNVPGLHLARGLCAMTTSSYKEALAQFDKAIQLGYADEFVPKSKRCVCLGVLGQYQEALKCTNQALAMEDSQELRMLKSNLEKKIASSKQNTSRKQ